MSQPQLQPQLQPPTIPPIPVQSLTYAPPPRGRHRITMAIVCLHISAGLYAIFAVGGAFLFHEDQPPLAWILSVVCGGLVLLIEAVVWGLSRRKYWAWIAGLVLFAMYVPSLFFIFGGLGLWGLLDVNSRAEFGMGERV